MQYNITCLNCGKPFVSQSRLSKFDTEACRKAYSRKKEPEVRKQLDDLSADINKMPDFIESAEPDMEGFLQDMKTAEERLGDPLTDTINILTGDKRKEEWAAGIPPATKSTTTKEPPKLDLDAFKDFPSGLKMFTSIIRNTKSSRTTKISHLNKLREAARVHPSLTNNQSAAICDRIRYYLDDTYSEKFLDNKALK